MATLEVAIALAVKAHQGQVDKAGVAYVLHPLRLMLKLETEEEQIVAVLHDVVEDSSTTLEDLRQMGFSATVLDALDHLTHRQEDDYGVYIQKISGNSLARKIKLLDLEDNMDIRRLDHQCRDRDWLRLKKYRTAWSVLKGLPSV